MVYLKKQKTALNESLAIAHSAKLGGWRIKGTSLKQKWGEVLSAGMKCKLKIWVDNLKSIF